MTALLYRLGHLCARRRLVVLGAWLVVALALGGWAAGHHTETNDNVSLPGTDSQRAADVLTRDFPSAANGTNPIVLRAPTGSTLSTPAQRAVVERLTAAYAADPAVLSAIGPLASEGASQRSRDGTIGYISLALRDGPAQLTEAEAQRLLDIAAPARAAGFRVAAGGYLGGDLSLTAGGNSEAIGLLAAIVVLLLTFGTVVAMGLPILSALFGLGIGLGLIAVLSQVVQIPSAAPALATMIGLGVGIDYALFVVTRHRAQLAAGVPLHEAVARATATAGGAVVFAGSTVVIALCSLLLTGIPLVAELGVIAAIAVLVAILAAITLLPASLALAGKRIESLRLPLPTARHDAGPRGWERWARAVVARPWAALVLALVLLAALALPLRDLQLGQSDSGQLPASTTARQAYGLLSEGFGPGTNGPLLVAVRVAPSSPARDAAAALARLRGALGAARGVAAVSPPFLDPDHGAALLTVLPTTAPSASATTQLVDRLRTHVIPLATRASGLTAYVGGGTAGYIDLGHQISEHLPLVIAVVLALSFVLLTLAFRSLLVPLKAVAMNLLSIGAAFGIVTYVFGHGWSSRLVGVEGTSPIVSFVPLMMFAILFGLSMDYEVFLMTHVRERWRATGDAQRAVVEGLAGTARVITSAALIMVCVFAAFLLDGNPTIKQFGLGMAAAVAVDATVVRCLLVPAILALLGRRAWWMPRRLERIAPPISIEGDAWFEQRDAAAAAAASAAAAAAAA
ncbi:MAG: hypothetical protein JWQ48_970, partial [Conexibacter sp.]|nr:hypothetical protein [Conexibacter sp.]